MGSTRNSYKLLIPILLLGACSPLSAADKGPQSTASRPYFTIFAASIDRLMTDFDIVFDAVDRTDLSESLSDRLKSYREFQGIDRKKPLGIMRTWSDMTSSEIVFLPVQEIDELLKTFTFGIVDYREVSPNQYEIARPGAPYHVLVRHQYAYLADSTATIEGLRVTPEQITRDLKNRYDVAVQFDLRQLPAPAKEKYVDAVRAAIEPWLQPQDGEAVEAANLRKGLGKLILNLFERLSLDTSQVTIGGRLDAQTRHLTLEVTVEAVKGSVMATTMNRMASQRSELSALVSSDTAVGLAVNLPLGWLVQQVLTGSGDLSKPSNVEAAIQLVGSQFGDFTLITALRGSDIVKLNKAIPEFIIRLENSDNFSAVRENLGIHQDVAFHSLVPRQMPLAISNLVSADLEIIIGQGTDTIWMALGRPEKLVERLEDAIDTVVEAPASRGAAPLVKAKIQARQLPEAVTSDALVRNLDLEASRAVLAEGDDALHLTIEPVSNGLKLTFEAEQGFVRLLGRDWSKQIDKYNPE